MQDLDKLPEDVVEVTPPIDSAFEVTNPELVLLAADVPLNPVDYVGVVILAGLHNAEHNVIL